MNTGSGRIGFSGVYAGDDGFPHWWKEIIHSVTCEYSNGLTEGYNNKIKVIQRNAYRFRAFKNFRKRILMNCMKSGNQAVA